MTTRQLSLFDTVEPESEHKTPDHLCFMSFGSGSSGNACYIGTHKEGVVIDAGVKAEDIEAALASRSIPMSAVKALLVTHDHSDHVRFAYTLLRRNKHIRFYCTNRVLNAILRHHSISRRIKEYHTPVFKEIPFRILDFEFTAFETSHDSTDSVGYFMTYGSNSFALATDLGVIGERADHYLRLANHLMIEANYDSRMLTMGRYPEFLKARIRAERGHLDNEVTAAYLAGIYRQEIRNVFLCHLSQDNNTPEKALEVVTSKLKEKGLNVVTEIKTSADMEADLFVTALPRFEPSRWFVLRAD